MNICVKILYIKNIILEGEIVRKKGK